MRSRSSATRRRASSSRVRSARTARSWISATKARRLRTASPAAAASAVQAKTPKFSWAYQGRAPKAMTVAVRTPTARAAIRQATVRPMPEATV